MWRRDMARAVGNRVVSARQGAGLTQAELVRAVQHIGLRYQQSELSRLERGMVSAAQYSNARLLTAIAAAAGADPLWLIFGVTSALAQEVTADDIGKAGLPASHLPQPPVGSAVASESKVVPPITPIGAVGIWEWDRERGLAYWSGATNDLFGVEDDARAFTLDEVLLGIYPDDQQLFAYVTDTYLKQGRPYIFQARLVRPNCEVRRFQSRGVPYPDEPGRTGRMVGTIQDITDDALEIAV
jgi:PAS domain-containing protein